MSRKIKYKCEFCVNQAVIKSPWFMCDVHYRRYRSHGDPTIAKMNAVREFGKYTEEQSRALKTLRTMYMQAWDGRNENVSASVCLSFRKILDELEVKRSNKEYSAPRFRGVDKGIKV